MQKETLLEVIEIYRQFFISQNIDKKDFLHDKLLLHKELGLSHCHGMLDKMIAFVHEDKLEKTFRWIGFIQGFLFAHGFYTLNELKDHNRSEDK